MTTVTLLKAHIVSRMAGGVAVFCTDCGIDLRDDSHFCGGCWQTLGVGMLSW